MTLDLSHPRFVRQTTIGSLAGVSGVAAACAVLGYEVVHAPAVAMVMVGAAMVGIGGLLLGFERSTRVVVASLPWFVLLIDRTPALTLTITSALAVLMMFSIAPPTASVGTLPWVAAGGFLIVVVAHAFESSAGPQFQEAAKYCLFPAMALFVSNPDARRRLTEMRTTLLISGVAAMAVQAGTALLHTGQTNVYYGVGEQLGLVGESPHELALVGVMLSVACLISVRRLRWRVIGAGITAAPAVATGVRSAVVALALGLIVLAIKARFRPSVILGIAAILGAVVFSGAGQVVVNRFDVNQASGQYSSFATAGSGRGALWTSALDQWEQAGSVRQVFGYGLRSIESIELARLGESVTGQSDPVSILVELGAVGLLAWLLVWLVLVRSGIRLIVLVPLAVYMILSGSMEYLGAIVYGIALAGALTPAKHLPPPVSAPAGSLAVRPDVL